MTPLRELAALFLRLGTMAFGGPAAHIAMLEDEVVRRRGWLSTQGFLDLIAVTNMIPGPNSTELAIHIGYQRAGVRGLLVAGISFILPATIIVATLAWIYVRFGQLPAAGGLLYGIKPVIIAIVAQALWRLGRTAIRSRFLAAVGVVAAAANFLGVHELIVLFGAAAYVFVAEQLSAKRGKHVALVAIAPFPIQGALAGAVSTAGSITVPLGLWPVFAVFLKIGSVLFGSGYVLLAFLRGDLVERLGWLTERQLLDAVAVGQFTPGPLFTTATFIGYLLSGPSGAAAATIGIFLPAFFFVAISAPFVGVLRKSRWAGRLLDGLNAASLALMAVVAWRLGHAAVIDLPTTIIALASAILLMRHRINSSWLIAAGGLSGILLSSA